MSLLLLFYSSACSAAVCSARDCSAPAYSAALGSEPGDDRHAYRKLAKISRKLDGALEAAMERAAEILKTASGE